jgi:hypothetical protein
VATVAELLLQSLAAHQASQSHRAQQRRTQGQRGRGHAGGRRRPRGGPSGPRRAGSAPAEPPAPLAPESASAARGDSLSSAAQPDQPDLAGGGQHRTPPGRREQRCSSTAAAPVQLEGAALRALAGRGASCPRASASPAPQRRPPPTSCGQHSPAARPAPRRGPNIVDRETRRAASLPPSFAMRSARTLARPPPAVRRGRGVDAAVGSKPSTGPRPRRCPSPSPSQEAAETRLWRRAVSQRRCSKRAQHIEARVPRPAPSFPHHPHPFQGCPLLWSPLLSSLVAGRSGASPRLPQRHPVCTLT